MLLEPPHSGIALVAWWAPTVLVGAGLLAGRPAHPEGLSVLGLAERAQSKPAASETLRRFLDQAPAHPADGKARRPLARSG